MRRSPPSVVERPLAAVRDRELVALSAGSSQTFGERRRRLARGEDAFEAAGAASARRLVLLHDLQLRLRRRLSGIRLSIANEIPSRARKNSPTPTPTDVSIVCSPSPNAKPRRVRHAVAETSGSATAAWSKPMLPGQSGKIVAMFISTSTSPAAGSGRSMSNARIDAHTANSWQQPAKALEEDRDRDARR